MNNDAELLRCYAEKKSEPAFTELVRRYVGLVYSVALRRLGGDAHLAEDVTQTVFNDLARKAPALRDRTALGGWLYLSAHAASAAMVRSERRRKARELAAYAMHANTSSDPDPDWKRLSPVIDDAIVDLKDEDREAVVLRFFEQRSFAEVGAALHVTDEAARKRVDRALEKLRATLQRRGVTSTAAALGIVLATIATTPVSAGLGAKVASHAFATAGASGGGVLLGGWLAIGLPAAAGIVLGGLVLSEHRANDALRDELGRFATDQAALASLQTENRELAQKLVYVDALRTTAAAPPAELPRRTTTAAPPFARPVAASIAVTAEGTIKWDSDYVSLAEFISRLRTIRMTGDAESRILVRTLGATFPAVTYVIEEARKAGIEHLTVEGGGKPDGKFSWWWF